MIPRSSGARKWPTKRRRADNQAGQAGAAEGFDDPSEAGEARERAREAELLAAAAAGEHEALRWLLDDVAPVVYGFVFARVGGDEATAEDLLQETLLEAVRGAAAFRGESAVSTWLCAIARRRLARYYETERRAEVARGSLRLVDNHVAAGLGADLVERQDEVVRALGRLPALQRQVLVLKYLEELSVEDIAGQVSRSRVQVQSLLQRGREGLRRQLGAQGA
ncbi:MAG TPA: sigma-70 family RNA polymerase sigma factor [Acidimicrobiales bacterium]|nr:sigma-70 family RNA polymerase sigma factor [Acidimicrobiales bacterium]